MGLVINTNIASINAQRALAASTKEMSIAMERLSSGKRINRASDDPAGFAIAERMTAQIRGLNMAAKNASDGLSMLSAVENATSDVTDMLQRMRELAVQAASDTNSAKDREYLQSEVSSLIAEIDRIASQTQYNGRAILDGSMSGSLQVGTEAGQNLGYSIASISSGNLGKIESQELVTTMQLTDTNDTVTFFLGYDAVNDRRGIEDSEWNNEGFKDLSIGDLVTFSSNTNKTYEYLIHATTSNGDLGFVRGNPEVSVGDKIFKVDFVEEMTTVAGSSLAEIDLTNDPSAALDIISAAIEQVAGDRAQYGALQNRLEYTISNLMNVAEFTTAARSRIVDADFAVESARLAKAQILQQAATAMLVQANASSQLALSLIR
ncbi:flagellin [Gammaproteobacteria bacterium]|nr:flagellin [Gammaproteobacteria bacterium]